MCGDRGKDVEESCVVDQLCINDRTEGGSLHQALQRKFELLAGPGVRYPSHRDDVVGDVLGGGSVANRRPDGPTELVVEFGPVG